MTIADTGIGIDANNLPRIFESGFSTRSGGHGLGLWIVGQTVERLKGRIQVTSQPGKGTQFHLSIPVIPESECDLRICH
jgi:signal transduction histidine kinase